MRLSPVGPAPMRRRSTISTLRHRLRARAIGEHELRSPCRVRARCSLSSDGVALPSTHTPPDAVRAEDRHVARVVADALLLLERRVVLLVDDDEPELRARARTARCGRRWPRRPRRRASRVHIAWRSRGVSARVEDRHLVAEAGAEARDELRRERDLGDEHDRAACRAARAAAMARRYTSVLPEPVTPWRRKVAARASASARADRARPRRPARASARAARRAATGSAKNGSAGRVPLLDRDEPELVRASSPTRARRATAISSRASGERAHGAQRAPGAPRRAVPTLRRGRLMRSRRSRVDPLHPPRAATPFALPRTASAPRARARRRVSMGGSARRSTSPIGAR